MKEFIRQHIVRDIVICVALLALCWALDLRLPHTLPEIGLLTLIYAMLLPERYRAWQDDDDV